MWIPYQEQERRDLNPSTSVSESRQPMLHSVCCNDTDTHVSAQSSLTEKDDSVAQNDEKRAFYTCLADKHRLQIWKWDRLEKQTLATKRFTDV